jgi:hypothetical protein
MQKLRGIKACVFDAYGTWRQTLGDGSLEPLAPYGG